MVSNNWQISLLETTKFPRFLMAPNGSWELARLLVEVLDEELVLDLLAALEFPFEKNDLDENWDMIAPWTQSNSITLDRKQSKEHAVNSNLRDASLSLFANISHLCVKNARLVRTNHRLRLLSHDQDWPMMRCSNDCHCNCHRSCGTCQTGKHLRKSQQETKIEKMCEVQWDQSKTSRFCEHCDSWLAKSLYYDHLSCEKSSSQRVKVKGGECCYLINLT